MKNKIIYIVSVILSLFVGICGTLVVIYYIPKEDVKTEKIIKEDLLIDKEVEKRQVRVFDRSMKKPISKHEIIGHDKEEKYRREHYRDSRDNVGKYDKDSNNDFIICYEEILREGGRIV